MSVEPERRGELDRSRRSAEQVHLGSRGPREHRGQQADRARSQHQGAVARVEVGAPDRAQGVTAGLDQGAERVIDVVGQRPQCAHRHRELLGERARTTAADADLGAELAHLLVPGAAPAAGAAAQHRVSGDAAAEPLRVDAVAERRDGAAHSWPMRIGYSANPRADTAISPVKNSTSVPHTPARDTSTTTSPGAATGASTS